MMRIKSLAVSHLRNDLHFRFFVEFCAIVAQFGAAAPTEGNAAWA